MGKAIQIQLNWSKEHVAQLKKSWKKYGKGHNLSAYNKAYQLEALKTRTSSQLQEIVNLKIPHLSEYAETVLKSRK